MSPHDPADPAPVPFAAEIARARAAVARAQRAGIDLADVDVAIRRGRDAKPAWWAERAERWPELGGDVSLAAARALLADAAGAIARSSRDLHDLQHAQRASLATPEHAALKAELDAALAELHAVMARRGPLQQRQAVLGPVTGVLDTVIAELAPEHGPQPPAAQVRSRAASVAPSARVVIELLGLEAELDNVVAALTGDEPVPALRRLRATFAANLSAARIGFAEADTRFQALNRALLERMG